MSMEAYLKNSLGELAYANCALMSQVTEQAGQIAALQAELTKLQGQAAGANSKVEGRDK